MKLIKLKATEQVLITWERILIAYFLKIYADIV